MSSKVGPRRAGAKGKAAPGTGRRIVENVNVPGATTTVDAAKYGAMLRAMRKALPDRAPGLTQAEMFEDVLPYLPEDLFPGGAKAGWWVKSVQLDQEAKGKLVREEGRPLRWHWRTSA